MCVIAASIDIETLSLKKDALVLSVGVVIFDAESGLRKARYELFLDPKAQPNRDISPSTVRWWFADQPLALLNVVHGLSAAMKTDASYVEFNLNPAELASKLAGIWATHSPEEVWFKGPQFDEVVLQSLLDGNVPWKYDAVRDMRTLEKKFGHVAPPTNILPVAHDALEDADAQADRIVDIMGAISRGFPQEPS
jgi:hypothetical protein